MTSEKPEYFSFSILSLLGVINKWKQKIFLFLFILVVLTLGILYLKPNIYYSYATAIPTNASLNDKSYLFNDKIDKLYSSLGSYDDLSRLSALAELDTTYKFIIHKYHLIEHYKIKNSNANIALQKAIMLMKDKYITFEKTENGLFRIHVYDENAEMASNIANTLMDYVEQVNSRLQVEYNNHSAQQLSNEINRLLSTYKKLSESSSKINNAADALYTKNSMANLMTEIAQLEKIKTQFETTLQFQQPSLRIVDKAIPNFKHVKPKRIFEFMSIMMIGLFGLIFMIIVIESLNSSFKKHE